MSRETFESVYREQIAELYDAEQQMIEEMPKIIRAVSSQELKTSLELHLAETKEQLARLGSIVAGLDAEVPRVYCDAMRALLAKSRLLAIRRGSSPVLDVALIATAQQIEQFEIAAYGTARMLARMLGHDGAAALLRRSHKEEQETVVVLAQIAESVLMGDELEDAALAEPAA